MTSPDLRGALLKDFADASVECFVWGATEVNEARRQKARDAILAAWSLPAESPGGLTGEDVETARVIALIEESLADRKCPPNTPLVLREALAEIRRLSLQSPPSVSGEWIAVSERLPDGNQESSFVFVFSVEAGRGIGYMKDGSWWSFYGGPLTVTHWQPLPPPPHAAPVSQEGEG